MTLDDINSFFIGEPLAPLVAAHKHDCSNLVTQSLRQITHVANRCEDLSIDGIGGVLGSLVEGFTVLDWVAKLGCRAILVLAQPADNKC